MMMMTMITMMMRSTTTTTFALWLFLTTSTHALDLDVTQVSCQDDLPLTTSLTSQGGTFGESMDLEGSLTLNGLEAYMMQDDDGGGGDNNEDNNDEDNNQNTQYNYLVYVNANIYGVVSDNLEYSLVDQQAWPLCDTIIAAATDDEDLVCPADGTYEYSTSFNLPSLPTDDSQFADWLASGWNGYIQLEMLSSNQEVVVGSCQISFVTSVTASDANTNKLAQSVSGKWGVFGILTLVLLTALSCCYCICCRRRRRRRQKTVEDVPETEFTRMPDTTTTSTNSTKTKPKGPPLTAGGGPAWTSV